VPDSSGQSGGACGHQAPLRGAGLETLTAMERVPTDADDRPKTDIRITGATVFVNPYKDEEEAERKAADAERAKVRGASALHPAALNPKCG